MENFHRENLDMIKFFERFNDIVFFINDESKIFSTDEFYNACKDETLIDVLIDLWFNLPELEKNRKKYLELVCNNFDDTKYFDNWWSALIYYTWQGLVHYFENNHIIEVL